MENKKQKDKQPSFLARTWKRLKKNLLYLFIFQLLYIIALRWIDPPITITQLQSWISGNGLNRDYVDADEISSQFKLAVIAGEDQLFPDHGGFDWKSIKKAMDYNEKKPNRVRGASTISQQVAKNVFLWQGRDWIRKGLEVYFTKMIEWIWGKKRILEVYVNVIEMGRGTFGVESAAQHYFKKSAKSLTKNEAALIAATLPNPKKYAASPPSSFVRYRANWIMGQMNALSGDPDIKAIIR